ncbi:hypothetical protein OXPF_10710 [Oxobacter pfennigii]|uniref:Uncharacterized protein n=1 Tax=Oxobacter pfennigii TaxID=36849 RepID=A0A0N8NTP1_9CLOT|nr:hypothetical protein [Oxobacter pfennigii]KPU45376.1 hypothetical protein OXPF_10710 [Oxobacter pfennigii]
MYKKVRKFLVETLILQIISIVLFLYYFANPEKYFIFSIACTINISVIIGIMFFLFRDLKEDNDS